jgi:hypothetical protein
VFKCENGGKTFYSDSPCLGAKKIDVEPTRGLNKSTGSERTGKDVSREMQREQFAEAVKCWIPCDHIPARSWALFKARDTLRGVIESLRQEARA